MAASRAGWTSPTNVLANGVLAPNSAAEVRASIGPREGVARIIGRLVATKAVNQGCESKYEDDNRAAHFEGGERRLEHPALRIDAPK
jgi:hypothetical protein